MPAAIPLALGAIGGSIGTALIGGVVGKAIGTLAGTFLGGALFGPDEPEAPSSAGTQAQSGVLLNARSSVAPIPTVYGRRRVGGPMVYINTTGTTNEYLHMVVVLSSGPVHSITDIELDDKSIFTYGDAIRANIHLGEENQDADADLVAEAANWTTAHRLRGVAYVYIRAKWERDKFSGLPNITAIVEGRKVYNPATAITEYSNNPALCIRDYLTDTIYGRGLDPASIDDQSIVESAAYCDSNPVATPYYTLNGVVPSSGSVMSNLKVMLASCRGFLTFTGGKYRLLIDKPEVASFTFNEDNIVGAWNINLATKRNTYNKINSTWTNPEKSWQPDIVVIDNASFKLSDNGLSLVKDLNLPFTTDFDMAHRISLQSLRQSRNQITVEFRATVAALEVEIGDIITIIHPTPGWDVALSKQFRVVRMVLTPEDEVEIVAMEYDLSVYTIDEVGSETFTANTNLPNALSVAAPFNLTFSELQFDTMGRGQLAWEAAPDAFVEEYEIQFKLQSSEVWLPAGVTTQTQINLASLDVDAYDFRVRAINSIGATSDWDTTTGSVTAPAILPRISGLELFGLANGTEFGGKDAKFVWRKASSGYSYDIGSEPQGANSGAWDLYFKDYEVRILDSDDNVLRVEHTVEPTYTYFFEKNVEDGGPRRDFTIEVFMRGRQNQLSSQAARMEVSNTPPALPSGLTITEGISQLFVTFTAATDIDYEGVLIYANTLSGYTPTVDDVVYDGPDTYIALDFPAGIPQYIRLSPYDAFGKVGLNVSAEFEATPISAFDTAPPATPTGLILSTEAVIASDGSTRAKVIADWDDNTEDDFVMYGLAVKEGGGNFVFGAADDSRAEWVVLTGTTVTVKVRAVDSSGNFSNYTAEESIVAGADLTPPGVITSVTAIPSLRAIFLQWTNPADDDFSYAAVYENTVDDSGTATEIAQISSDYFVRSGLNTGDTRYYWLKAVDFTGNESGFHAVNGSSATTGAIVGGDIPDDTIVGDMIVGSTILTEHLLAGEIDANVLKSGTILTAGVNIASAFQTAAGQTAVNVGSWSENPLNRANAKTTQLSPGLVQISGGTTLSDWRYGGDNTKIDGGNVGANTITANALKIGNRNLLFSGLEFTANSPSSNQISWTSGSVTYATGTGGSSPIAISAGNSTFTSGTLYIYWVKDATSLSATTNQSTALGAENILLASYRGGTDLVATYGRTTVEGDHIRTNSIVANHLTTGELLTVSAQIKDAIITDAKIATLTAAKITAGVIGANSIFLGANSRFRLDASTNRLTVNDGTRDRVRLGGLGSGNFGIEIFDASGNTVLSSGGTIPQSVITGLGSLASLNSVSDSEITGVSNSKVSGLGALATQSSVGDSQITGVSNSKVSGLGSFALLSQIDAGNISTYIASAAIGEAYIGNLAVSAAKIKDLAVESGKIANLSVGTIKVADGAISNSSSSSLYSTLAIPITGFTTVLQSSITTNGGRLQVDVTAIVAAGGNVRFKVLDGATLVWPTTGSYVEIIVGNVNTPKVVTFPFVYLPAAGSRTLSLQLQGTFIANGTVTYRSIILTEVKK